MKECTRYLDYLERADSSCDSAEWQDILAHAAHCPDCSMAMKNRGEMLEQLASLDEPDYPLNLHQRIVNEVEESVKNENSGFNVVDKILEKFLRPIELGFSLACIIMIFSLISAETKDAKFTGKKVELAYKNGFEQTAVIKSEDNGRLKEKNKLQAVSKEEIEEFLFRLNRFNRAHGNNSQQKVDTQIPELKLVNDWK